jgi:hypothetical protein
MMATTKAQNYVDFSRYDIENAMQLKGFTTSYDKTDDGTLFLTASSSQQVRIYYFNKNNVCIRYVYTIEDASYSLLEQALKSNGYERYSDGFFYYKKYKANIVYTDILKCWVVVVDPK